MRRVLKRALLTSLMARRRLLLPLAHPLHPLHSRNPVTIRTSVHLHCGAEWFFPLQGPYMQGSSSPIDQHYPRSPRWQHRYPAVCVLDNTICKSQGIEHSAVGVLSIDASSTYTVVCGGCGGTENGRRSRFPFPRMPPTVLESIPLNPWIAAVYKAKLVHIEFCSDPGGSVTGGWLPG
ncbi:hypothetical protein B0J12DRAFT_652381 [Macrophomina phaseolina]|uniref:Uncharacterized protein n=1 Tax=Macrophomina phaseolina TaxID=35725 RepID=A0ABQ8GKT5_9PEZI|nr:hypothetical protein B0J12DRAFT_652381 [Macrophomina phaseolina]